MASSDKTAADFRRNDPDETEGRRLYRGIANAIARQQIALTRAVRMKQDADTPVPAKRAARSHH
ncbi:MAG: hypothetical protein Q8R02_23295 [Hyphomonadaceae bacterium]|nr:hypothetical protein [Hyphomonadaceae bacterium]